MTDRFSLDTNEAVKFNKKSGNQKKSNLRERNITEEDSDNEDVSESVPMLELEQTDKSSSTKVVLENEKSKDDVPLDESKAGKAKKMSDDEPISAETTSAPKDQEGDDATKTVNTVEEAEELPVKKPKLDRTELIKQLFTKRTVGVQFEEARKRYLERKALRQI